MGQEEWPYIQYFKTMSIKKGDQIILPAFTCTVVPNAIIYAGARPIYVDIEPKILI